MQKIKNQKGITPLIILGAIMFLLLGVGGGYVISKKITKQAQKQENKIVKEEKKEQKEEDREETGNKKDETADWETYKNEEYGFEMKYPKEFMKISASNFGSARGSINLNVISEKFDPKNIQGILEKIKNPTLVKIGNKDGYQYDEADGGCAWEKIRTGLNNNNATLDVSFMDCGENFNSDLTLVVYDKDLISQILSTFKFSEQISESVTPDL